MTEKKEVLENIFWLGIELLDDDFDEAELTIKDIRKYIKETKGK